VCLQLTPKNVETQCWIAKTVWQRIPGRRTCNSKTPTTITVQTIARNDQLPLTGRPQNIVTGLDTLDTLILCNVQLTILERFSAILAMY